MIMWRKRLDARLGAKTLLSGWMSALGTTACAARREVAFLGKACICRLLLLSGMAIFVAYSEARASEVLVRFHPAKGKMRDVRTWAQRYGVEVKRRLLLPGGYIISSVAPASRILSEIKTDPALLYASVPRVLEPCATLPNDPLFANQWQLRNTGQSGGVVGADIGAPLAWDVTTGSAHTVLAIVDSGIELSHPDLVGRLWVNPGEIPGNGLDDDNNGFTDDVHGWNFYSGSPDVSPTLGHGTNVAGLAGAASNNGIGVAGVNWQAPLMIANIFSPEGYATEADAVDALVYACDNGARVINASWGSPGYSPLLEDAVAYAREKNVLICAAAGNYNFDADEHPFYPAALGSDALIAVGGTTNRDDWVFNYGAARVHVSAPANLVYMARYPSTYGYGSGTSYAAPLVAGTAGLLLAQAPNTDVVSLKSRLVANATRLDLLSGRNVVGGRLNAAAALTSPGSETPPPLSFVLHRIGPHGALFEIRPPNETTLSTGILCQIKVASESITTDNFAEFPEWRMAQLGPQEHRLFLLDGLEQNTTYWIGARGYNARGIVGELTTTSFTTGLAKTVFYDSCDTTAPVWQAAGFTLAGGSTHTGTMAWQDSPDSNYTSNTVATLTGGPFDISSLVRPRLSFYLEYFFPSRLAEGDRLEVRVSSDGGATWSVLKRFHATHSPPRRFSFPLDEFRSTQALLVQFRLLADENSYVDDGVYIDDIALEEGLGDVPFADDVIIESVDFFGQVNTAPEFEVMGAWSADSGKSSAPKLVGAGVLAAPAGSAGTRATFIPFVPISGKYEIFLSYGALASATNVQIQICHAEGSTQELLNQMAASGNRWVSLGIFNLRYGRDRFHGSVSLDASTATGAKVFADAVRFVLVEPAAESLSAKDWLCFE